VIEVNGLVACGAAFTAVLFMVGQLQDGPASAWHRVAAFCGVFCWGLILLRWILLWAATEAAP